MFFGAIDAVRMAHPASVAIAARGRRHGCRDAHREDPDRLRLVQLPFHNPVRLAVQLALLDNLSRGRIDVGVGKGTIYNEYDFVGHGLRSDDSRERMEEAVDIIGRLWGGGPVTYNGKYFQVQVPQLRPRPVQRPHLPLWRGVISPSSFSECGRLGVPILTARLPVARIKERWAAYGAGLDAGGHERRPKHACWRRVRCGATFMSPDPMRRRRTSYPLCCCRPAYLHLHGRLLGRTSLRSPLPPDARATARRMLRRDHRAAGQPGRRVSTHKAPQARTPAKQD